MTTQAIDNNTLYLIYDGECPLCRSSAQALNIKKAVGNLVLINARESHPLVDSAYARGFDPEVGIIVFYKNQYYFGADAAHFLAVLNSPYGFVNKLIANVFRIKWLAILLYPMIKSIRHLFLRRKNVGAIVHNKGLPIFATVFGEDWQKLSPLMRKRFSNRPNSNDVIRVTGNMTIKSSRWMRLIKPLMKMSGALIQQDGDNIPVTVQFKSELNSSKYWFVRQFKFDHIVHFKSYMVNIKDNVMVEFMRFNIGWRTKFSVKGDCVLMSHNGYVFRCLGMLIPLPIGLLLGKCNVVEYQVSDNAFNMEMSLEHFIFGTIYEYKGTFSLV